MFSKLDEINQLYIRELKNDIKKVNKLIKEKKNLNHKINFLNKK